MSDLHLRFNGHTKRDNAMQRLLGGYVSRSAYQERLINHRLGIVSYL